MVSTRPRIGGGQSLLGLPPPLFLLPTPWGPNILQQIICFGMFRDVSRAYSLFLLMFNLILSAHLNNIGPSGASEMSSQHQCHTGPPGVRTPGLVSWTPGPPDSWTFGFPSKDHFLGSAPTGALLAPVAAPGITRPVVN